MPFRAIRTGARSAGAGDLLSRAPQFPAKSRRGNVGVSNKCPSKIACCAVSKSRFDLGNPHIRIGQKFSRHLLANICNYVAKADTLAGHETLLGNQPGSAHSTTNARRTRRLAIIRQT